MRSPLLVRQAADADRQRHLYGNTNGPAADSRAASGYSIDACLDDTVCSPLERISSARAGEVSMPQKVISTRTTLIAAVGACILGGQVAGAQQQSIMRTELLRTYLDQLKVKQMQVWVADITPR